jgi:hypothetical protein
VRHFNFGASEDCCAQENHGDVQPGCNFHTATQILGVSFTFTPCQTATILMHVNAAILIENLP